MTERRYIVTEDMDFFDPKHKKSAHETKERIKERNCAVCAYLRKHMNIVVGKLLHAQAELLAISKRLAVRSSDVFLNICFRFNHTHSGRFSCFSDLQAL